jgi:hypothetical protein
MKDVETRDLESSGAGGIGLVPGHGGLSVLPVGREESPTRTPLPVPRDAGTGVRGAIGRFARRVWGHLTRPDTLYEREQRQIW